MQHRNNKTASAFVRGFTLIELLIVIAIIVFLATFGFIALLNYIKTMNIQSAQNELTTTINAARSRAMSQVKGDGATCGIGVKQKPVLGGYRIVFCGKDQNGKDLDPQECTGGTNPADYEEQVFCGDTEYEQKMMDDPDNNPFKKDTKDDVVKKVTLPKGVSFKKAPKFIFFHVLTGKVDIYPPGDKTNSIILADNNNNEITMTISDTGLITFNTGGLPTDTPTPTTELSPTDTPTPTPETPTNTPTPTPDQSPDNALQVITTPQLGILPAIKAVVGWDPQSLIDNGKSGAIPNLAETKRYFFQQGHDLLGFTKVRFMDVLKVKPTIIGPIIDDMYDMGYEDIMLDFADLQADKFISIPGLYKDPQYVPTDSSKSPDCANNGSDLKPNTLEIPFEDAEASMSAVVKALHDHFAQPGKDFKRFTSLKFELVNEYGFKNTGCVLQDFTNEMTTLSQQYSPDNPLQIILPSAQRAPLTNPNDSFHLGLKNFGLGNYNPPPRFEGVSLHFYLRGNWNFSNTIIWTYENWLNSAKQALSDVSKFNNNRFDFLKPPLYITEFGVSEDNKKELLKDSLNAAWMASRLGDTNFYDPSQNMTFYFSALYGQPPAPCDEIPGNDIDDCAGFLGLYDGWGHTRAHYPVERQLEFEKLLGHSTTLYAVQPISSKDIPQWEDASCNTDTTHYYYTSNKQCVGGVSDNKGKWLLWNLTGKDIQVSIPSTLPRYIGRIDKTHGNSSYSYPTDFINPLNPNQALPIQKKLDNQSNPFNDPSTGIINDAVTPTKGYIPVTIGAEGVAFVTDSTDANTFQCTECALIPTSDDEDPPTPTPTPEDNDITRLANTWRGFITGGDTINLADSDIQKKITAINAAADNALNGIKTPTGQGDTTPLNLQSTRSLLWNDIDPASDPKQQAKKTNWVIWRLNGLAAAYATKGTTCHATSKHQTNQCQGTTYYQNPKIAKIIVDALDFFISHNYTNGQAGLIASDWWYWQLGIPSALNDTIILVDQQNNLTPSQKGTYVAAQTYFEQNVPTHGHASPSELFNDVGITGANRSWFSQTIALRGVVGADIATVKIARDGLSGTKSGKGNLFVNANPPGDGFYADGSFIQHHSSTNPGYAYTGSYGVSALSTVATMVSLFNSVPTTTISDPSAANMYTWITNSFDPVIYKGRMMDIVKGRTISRYMDEDYVEGNAVTTALLQLLPTTPANLKTTFQNLLRQWIEGDKNNYNALFVSLPLPLIGPAKTIVDTIPLPSDQDMHTQFGRMDRTIHKRNGATHGLSASWAYAIGMHSTRTDRYEVLSTNGTENMHGWYTGEGATSFYTDLDPKQYSNNFWATVDPYFLPGTTVELTPRKDIPPASNDTSTRTDWAGGVTLNTYGVASMKLGSMNNALTGKKAYFFFDNEIVALGTDIKDTNAQDVVTTIENRKLKEGGTNQFVINDISAPAPKPSATPYPLDKPFPTTAPMPAADWEQTISNAKWAYLENSGGYIFPDNQTVHVTRQERIGLWSFINSQYPLSTENHNFFMKLWFNHTQDKTNSYSYIFLPNATLTQTKNFNPAQTITIVKNNSTVQGVQHRGSRGADITGAIFWEPTSLVFGTTPLLSTTHPLAVMTQQTATTFSLAIADPQQLQKGTASVTVYNQTVACRDANRSDANITYTKSGANMTFTISFSGANAPLPGESSQVNFKLSGTPDGNGNCL